MEDKGCIVVYGVKGTLYLNESRDGSLGLMTCLEIFFKEVSSEIEIIGERR